MYQENIFIVLLDIFRSVRPVSITLWVLIINLYAYHLNHKLYDFNDTIILFMIGCSANLLNDVFDYDMDTTGNKNRLLQKYSQKKYTKHFMLSFIVLNQMIYLIMHSHSLSFKVFLLLSHWIYGRHGVTSIPILKNIWVSVNCTTGLYLSSQQSFDMGILLYIFFYTFFYEIIKDMIDYESDKQAGLNTFVVLFGIEMSLILGNIITLVSIVIQLYYQYYFVAFVLGISHILIGILYIDRNQSTIKLYKTILEYQLVIYSMYLICMCLKATLIFRIPRLCYLV